MAGTSDSPGPTRTPPAASSEPGGVDPGALAAIVARAGRGGADAESAWRELVGMYTRRLYALARARGLGEEASEEVTQSVFATLARHISGDRPSAAYAEQGRFEAWLFRVAVNRIRDEVRRRRRRALTGERSLGEGEPLSPAAPQTPPTPAADLHALRRALHDLPDADREVVSLRHHGGLSFKQIADLLEEPLGTVLARHHRALRKLKDLLEPPADDLGEPGSPRIARSAP